MSLADKDRIAKRQQRLKALSDAVIEEEIRELRAEQDRRRHLKVEQWRNDPTREGCQAGRDGECNWNHCPQNDPATRLSTCPRHVEHEDD